MAGTGEALPEPVRGKMEHAFGDDFGDVRVHQDGEAERVGAQAYTQGSELHFEPGRYAPGSPSGDELIGHELTHVVQQRAGRVAAPQQHKGGINDDPALEAEADDAGARAAAGQRVAVPGAAGVGVSSEAPVQRKLTVGKEPDPRADVKEPAAPAEVDRPEPVAARPERAPEGAPEPEQEVAIDQDESDDAEPAATPGKTVKLGGGIHIVEAVDTLKKISEREYGERKYWKVVKRANRDKVGRGNRLREGDVLTIPEAEIPTLMALRRFEDQPEQMRDLVVMMSGAEYDGFMASLTPAEKEKHAYLLQVAEMSRVTRMTIKELAGEQRKFLEEKATDEGQTVEDSVADVVETQGYGNEPASEYEAERAARRLPRWQRRFRQAVRSIKTSAPPDVMDIIKTAEDMGGGFAWSPKEVEENGAFAYTAGDWKLHCGFTFVKEVEQDSSRVYGNIAHEMGGHNFYGDREVGAEIAKQALSEEEREAAERSGNTIFSAYGYMETEIFSELYEYPYDRVDSPSDHPFDSDIAGNDMMGGDFEEWGDVIGNLETIQTSFAPTVARGIVAGLGRRVALDARIVPDAKDRFRKAVFRVFGFFP